MITEFTPLASLAGGALIGLAAAVLMATNGRIAGISGFIARLLPPYDDSGFAARLAFVAGLAGAPLVYALATGSAVSQTVSDNLPLMAVAGLLVGFGSVLGGGCTSGHGVCGLARLSKRSFIAIGIVMASAGAVVFASRHIFGA